MDTASVILLLGLIAEGIGVVDKYAELARRVKAGEKITDDEIAAARKAVLDARGQWDAAGQAEI